MFYWSPKKAWQVYWSFADQNPRKAREKTATEIHSLQCRKRSRLKRFPVHANPVHPRPGFRYQCILMYASRGIHELAATLPSLPFEVWSSETPVIGSHFLSIQINHCTIYMCVCYRELVRLEENGGFFYRLQHED